MLSVVFVRHGVTEATGDRLGGRTPASLSDTGRRQAAAVAGRLGDADVVAVYASPVARARETATIIAERHDLEAVQLDGVAEVDYGDWTDQSLDDLRETGLWPAIQHTPSRVGFPGGETIRGAQARAVDAVEAIVARHDPDGPSPDDRGDLDTAGTGDDVGDSRAVDDSTRETTGDGSDDDEDRRPPTVVVASHADVIKAVGAHFVGAPLDVFQRLVVGPASVTVLGLSASPSAAPRLLVLNDTCHLHGEE